MKSLDMRTRWIALLQDVTACEDTTLSADFGTALESLGLEKVKFEEDLLFAQFDSELEWAELEDSLKRVVRECCGLRARYALLTQADFQRIADENPFRNEASDQVYTLFLKQPAAEPSTQQLDALMAAGEEYSLIREALYLLIPTAFAESKLAQQAQPVLGVGAVVRSGPELGETVSALS